MFEIADDTALLWATALVAIAALFCIVAYQAVFPPLGGCLAATGRIVYRVVGRRRVRPEGRGGRHAAARLLLAGEKAPGLDTVVTLGIWSLVWNYKIHTNPDHIYAAFHDAEDTVLQTVRAA